MVELNLKNIYKKYPNSEHYSVEDFNLDIKDKEFIVFVGPSGCGKSTTLRMIAGLEDITEGECSIDGRVVNDVAPKDRDIAMVFQNYALYPHMTVHDNMAFGLKLRKYSKDDIEKRVNEAAEILGLKEFLDRKPADLSGGQRQRVAMGRAIVRDAKVFLMDEPLSNLDAKLRVSMRAEIAKIHRRIGATTIYVTHDQTEAMTLADRIVIMSATKNPSGTGTIGRVEQIGTPQEVYKKPVNKFVAGFIGSPAMNFINVTLKGDEIVAQDLSLKVPEGALKVLREKGYEGKKLIFGIRPEDINTEAAFLETFPDSVVHAKISVSELLGSESHLYCQVADNEFIAKVDARDYLKAGAGIDLGFDLNKAHFFDPETEKTVY
ncbi:sn-glycerol-3-phosphate ABC transporter ATP-binding protein UgpC [Streptococcus anginosus]|mgnify:FL=1|uniref:Sn-glycerol-3-phosphate ABC transporter ATP-binding protein UgpC n=2 Tax=Streptococcus TaxID=1301 RepID=A0AAU7PYV8_9STRE|nr:MULTISPECIES: sn-glycerol-3-phosphate ABC transporter ATP-binding protein UgpC [Streptococcus]MBC5618532.1 sn-glycerol-3-phosphate ABC transporter ATP-binding protein UgpC [Streptococcus hominis]MCW0924741.1 sn-glycerol-3-phosphate ABC transporter ATP-binding protein UgpC [Streptococcus anginosus]PRT69081.1 sn-glycerol-3-phosphate ABC transporter ATP-binding protein UgpC [Streptococcus anginosus]QOG24272.1 sn-glycerol-3-phosphate ABC transporter ATP-binding protein UgpC [Streptococcus sp. KS